MGFVAESKMIIHQMDVKTAFLNGELEENIYMEQPEGYVEKEKENLVCKMKKSLYGLKQSPRCWNRTFANYLKEMGFKQIHSDPCIFIRQEPFCSIKAVYVNDLFLFVMVKTELEDIKKKRFSMKDLGNIHY